MGSAYRYWRSPPAASAQFVANKLAGAPLHSLGGGRTVVPLLHPQQHGLPFALTLELHAAPHPPAAAAGPLPPLPAAPDRRVFALHYVLAGSGELRRPGSGAEQLQAGDAVLMHAGAAAVGAGASGAAGGSLGPFEMAEVVAYLPQELFEQQQQQPVQQPAQPTFMLPLLQHGGGSGGVSSSGSSTAEQRLSEELSAALLAGARDTARQAVRGTPPPEAAASRQASAQPQPPASSTTGSPVGGRALQLLQAAAASLADWWAAQQGRTCPVTKRQLADLTAFQLPNQSNRLAVQFDPYSPPQVPFISGIEVFEPRHRTTPHVHPHAHELFFILAGEGTGFCGQERFPVRAGDVVVFRPGAVHGIDNGPDCRMYCLELMVPNEEFAEYVRAGTDTGHLAADDMCVLASIGCR